MRLERAWRGLVQRFPKHPNFYIDTSAHTVQRYPRALVDYLRSNGSTKVLFGSNYPMITPSHALAALDTLGLEASTKALFLGGYAQRVYQL